MRVAILFLLAAAGFTAELKVDHATVAAADLKRLEAGLRNVGMEPVFGGAHTNGVTEMALVSFPDGSYLELMGIQAGSRPAAIAKHEWAPFLTGDAGPCAWALRERDLSAEVARLRAAGVAVSQPEEGGRQRPDGVALKWQTSSVGQGTRGQFFPFLIQDVTPREQRVYPKGRPVTREFRGISRVVIAVRNLDEAVKRYRQAYGLPAPIKQVDAGLGAQLALLGGSPVVLAAPLNSASWLAERLERYGEGPCAFVLAAVKLDKWKAGTESQWFGAKVKWLDAGWRLGVEAAR